MQKHISQPDSGSALHLAASVRTKAEEISTKEGLSLNEFVNEAVAEKLAHYQHAEWVKSRRAPTPESIMEARRILRKAGSEPPQPGDELPEGYVWPEI